LASAAAFAVTGRSDDLACEPRGPAVHHSLLPGGLETGRLQPPFHDVVKAPSRAAGKWELMRTAAGRMSTGVPFHPSEPISSETGRGRQTCGGGRSATGSCIELLGRVVLPKASCAAIGRFCWKTLIGTTSRPKRSIIVRRSSAWASSE